MMLPQAPSVDMSVEVEAQHIWVELIIKNENSFPFRVDKNRVGQKVGSYTAYLWPNHVDKQGEEILNQYGRASISSRVATGYRGPYSEEDIVSIPPHGQIKSRFDIAPLFVWKTGCQNYRLEYRTVFDFPLIPEPVTEEQLSNVKLISSKSKPVYFEYCKEE